MSKTAKVQTEELLCYNLKDTLATFWVYNNLHPKMVVDQQEDIYTNLFKPSAKLILQMELTGMAMSRTRISEVRLELESIQEKHEHSITSSPLIKVLNQLLTEEDWEDDYESRKAKAKNPQNIKPKDRSTYPEKVFNPNSGPQLQKLLYKQMGLPVLDYTDTKQPATGADTIEKLINHTQEPAYKELLGALIGYGKVTKILTTFIPAFEKAISKDGGDTVWLHGNFNLGGTVSGRLSSSDPNLTNLPAGSDYGKLIKSCFVSPKGMLFAGADFASLEDYVSALTTKDKNKLAVYEQGYCGHCLRAAYYFREQLPHIDLKNPASVNTIKKTHPDLRQDSKPGTFLLTYGGTYHGLMNNLGWDEEKAKRVEANYHALYKESDDYVQERLQQASKDGYVTVAFGLRVRTPLLKQVMFGSTKMPYEAAAEGRTAGNALGQSYCMLTMRSLVEFMEKVWRSKYRYQIWPVAMIHDASYLLIKDDIEVVEWANKELTKSMAWQELTELQHPTVKINAALDLFWPDWSNPITLPVDANQATILALCEAKKAEVLKAA